MFKYIPIAVSDSSRTLVDGSKGKRYTFKDKGDPDKLRIERRDGNGIYKNDGCQNKGNNRKNQRCNCMR